MKQDIRIYQGNKELYYYPDIICVEIKDNFLHIQVTETMTVCIYYPDNQMTHFVLTSSK